MTQPFVGEIRPYAFSYPPYQWAQCAGQLISIQQNTPLYAILGTTYGGNGQSNFALPDLRGRIPIGTGNGPEFQAVLGQVGGANAHTLLSTEMPSHTHNVSARVQPTTAANQTNVPTAGYFISRFMYHATSAATAWRNGITNGDASLHPATVGVQGGSQAHENRQPYIALNWCIALYGSFPARN